MLEWEWSPKTLLYIAGIAAVLLMTVSAAFFKPSGQLVEVRGTVVAPFERPADDAAAYYLRVALASGDEVFVRIPRTLTVRPGREVVLTARRRPESALFGFQFERYAEAESKQ
jgi:hypothetical protein